MPRLFSILRFFTKLKLKSALFGILKSAVAIIMPKMNPKHKPKTSSLAIKKTGTKRRAIPSASTKKPLTKKCGIKGCVKDSIHTLSISEYEPSIKKIGLTLRKQKGARRFNICKDHYKKMKKAKKKDEKLTKPHFVTDTQKIPKRDKISNFFE